ncbi:MAG: cold shock and DUF1294 domain-containing protein [Coriobacteriia bacterium]|nr:cold shock and DUF1294 domain-containing protein [Coriobacteriia bacterium]
MAERGRLTDWNDDRGFGYIQPLDGGPTVFVHVSTFPPNRRRPIVTDLLTYDVGTDDRGRARAANVHFLSAAGPRSKANPAQAARPSAPASSALRPVALVAGGFLTLTCLLAAVGAVAWVVPAVYVAMSGLAFLTYGSDKLAAESGDRRTGEGTLIGLGLIGGWPGALVAQEFFRHKTRKQPFRTLFFASIAANVVLLIWIATAMRIAALS